MCEGRLPTPLTERCLQLGIVYFNF